MGKLVEIAHFYGPEEAFCAQGYLEAQGIKTFLQNEHHLSVVPWLRIALGGYRLLIDSEFADDAKIALSATTDRTLSQELTDSSNDNGAPDVSYPSRKNWLWLPTAFTAEVPFVPIYKSWTQFLFQSFALLLIYLPLILAIIYWLNA